MSLSKILNDVEKMNWSKGPAALEILMCSLYDYTGDTWKQYLYTWSKEEQEHIPEFIKHAELDWFEYCGKKDNDAWKCKCSKSTCTSIISRLLQIHQNPRSRNLKWKTKISPGVKQYVNYSDFFWEFAKMYMFYGTEKTEEIFTCPTDTDIVMILKMMKNCKLFELDDNNLYETVRMCRNSFMHASHYKMSTQGLEDCVNAMNSLLEAISEKDDVLPQHKLKFSSARTELNELVKHKIRMDMSKEELDTIVNALQWQQKSIESDMQFKGINGQNTEALKEFLEKNTKQINHFTIIIKVYQPILNIDDPDKRRKALEVFEEKARREEEKKRRENKLKEDIEKRKKGEEEKKITDEVMKRFNAMKANMQGNSQVTGAAIGGTIGMAAGPLGAAVGGTIGSYIGGLFGGNN